MLILLTGGTGYIGSHTAVELLSAGHNVVIVDNLSNSSAAVLHQIKCITGQTLIFYQADVTDAVAMARIFAAHAFDGVIHFAGLKAVAQSVDEPISYYHNNVTGTIVLAQMMARFDVRRLVYSSSATVYGDNLVPYREDLPLLPAANPYGWSKAMSEQILTDIAKVHPCWSVTFLRYFNPVGAHHSGLIGESPIGVPNNLMPYICQAAQGRLSQLQIFGDDYPTPDGTCIRDYLHVCDLAQGHLRALERVTTSGVHIFNLGTGRGISVLELVRTFEKVNKVTVPYRIAPRRAGDLPAFYADVSKAERELAWKAQRSVEEMCRDAWRWQQTQL